MRSRSLFACSCALLFMGAAVVVACSDDSGRDGSLSLQEYVLRLDAIRDDLDRTTALESPCCGGPDEIQRTREDVHAYATIFGEAVDALAALDPPADAAQAHGQLLDALRSMLDVLEDNEDRLADVESMSDLEAFRAEAPGVSADWEQFRAACYAIEDIAADNAIAVDLYCRDEEP